MNRFGPDPQAFFEAMYWEPPPWDVGGPQPALIELLDDFPAQEPVLDLGCGSGDLAIHVAQRGLEVLGIDFVEAAITQAREKASHLPAEVRGRLDFEVADALQPSDLGRTFGSVLDSGFYHLFEPDQGQAFVDDLAGAIRPGGFYYLLAFDIEFDIPNVPRKVSQQELRSTFTPEKGWRILDLQPVEFQSRIAPTPAIRACIERITAGSP